MDVDLAVLLRLFTDTLAYWWIILPATVLGILVGAVPGFSAANTIIILLPLTLAMSAEAGMIFMVAIYTASRLGASRPWRFRLPRRYSAVC
jgi:putative tricarboxylic transport membrane protein